jgi:DNA-binding NtrC family response regulator
VDSADRTLIEGQDEGPAVTQAVRQQDELLVLLECDRPLALSSRHSLSAVDLVVLGRGKQREMSRAPARDQPSWLTLPDRWLSTRHAQLTRQQGDWWVTDTGSTNGTRVNGQTAVEQKLEDGDLIEVGHSLLLFRSRVEVPQNAAADLDHAPAPGSGLSIVTLSPALGRCLDKLEAVTAAEVSILILGPSGTGKEVLARQIARGSPRPGKFVAVNCAAIPAGLIESELFGSRKGAFSGADADRIGLVRTADRGWLFLDEIGDLPLAAQAALLRVLQEREVRPVGSASAVPVDLRVISATHQNLDQMARDGKFRADLLARIAGFRVALPPLCERREDLGILIGTLLARDAAERADSCTLSPDAASALFHYPWPFNVRELRDCLATACALAKNGPIRLEHLPENVRSAIHTDRAGTAPESSPKLSRAQEQHRDELVRLLEQYHGNISALARATGKARTQYQRWFRRYGLDPKQYRK